MTVVTPAFVDALPKAELHVHLEGTIDAATAFACARRNRLTLPWRSEAELKRAYEFEDLPAFLSVLFRVSGTLRQAQDFYDLAVDYARRAHADGVVRAEVFFGAQTFLDAGVPIATMLDAILAAFRDAAQQWGIDARLICTAQRHRDESTGLQLLELIEPWRDRIIGVGLGSAERGNPPAKFARYFAEAKRRGYRTTIHAGEDGPASYVE
jgi:adenine deaminase